MSVSKEGSRRAEWGLRGARRAAAVARLLIIHALDLLEALDEDAEMKQRCISTLRACK